jgi:hypothetical protein|nr:MAG TPA: Portal protein dodecamer 3.3A [Caudoviricetes sp.]
MKRKPWEPEQIFEEYETGRTFKSGLGRKGLYEQGKINERFYIGDQWHGARCGNDRPLVRHNVIKRIGDYKMAVVASNPVTVNYSVEGVPNTVGISDRARDERDAFAQGQISPQETMGLPPEEELAVTMTALSDYFKTTAERVKFDDLKEQALRNAYVSGTGVLYTYWDDKIRTGLYADESGTTPIQGDIACEVLDIENVYFGDPNLYDVQAQPYIIIAQRKSVADLQREARRNGRSEAEIDAIKPDRDTGYMAGDMAEDEPEDSRKATVLTKFWKEWAKDGTCKIMASVAVRGATIRYRWDTKLRLYPLAVFRWERRRNCAYGESEITYLIPNQIAINRMLTASVWAVMMLGMPLTLVNGDVVNQPITNDPGQIIKINGTSEDMLNAVRYVNPPNFAPAFDNNIASLISNTLTQSGANDAALGDVRPDNTSAIVAVREAATMPMQTVQNRFYSFVEDVARVWAEMWVTMYGRRSLKIEDENGVWYMPFDGEKYRDLLISVKVDVGASTLWSEIQSVNTLDNLLASQIITPKQYLERLPKGSVPNLSGLIREMQEAQRAQEEAAMQAPEQQGVDVQAIIDGLPPEYRQAFDSVPPEQQTAMLQEIGVM